MRTTGKILWGTAGALTLLLLWRKKLNDDVNESAMHPNVKAFLMAIRHSEGTSGANGYQTTFGGGLFHDMSDHPAITGEWPGAPLPDQMCLNAGIKPPCKSTAAGAYQFLRPTWRELKAMLLLPDFGPASQDLAALELIRRKGALDDIKAGRITDAVNKVKTIWASVPGAPYGQPTAQLSTWLNTYENSGGSFA